MFQIQSIQYQVLFFLSACHVQLYSSGVRVPGESVDFEVTQPLCFLLLSRDTAQLNISFMPRTASLWVLEYLV